jgi:hypothetical protein
MRRQLAGVVLCLEFKQRVYVTTGSWRLEPPVSSTLFLILLNFWSRVAAAYPLLPL